MKPTTPNLLKRLAYLHLNDETRPFEMKCRDWLGLGENRDRRGTSSRAVRQAYYACLWLEEALRAREHEDPTVRREAQQTVRGLRHQSFPEILERLGKLHGLKSRMGKRAADRRREAAERTIGIDDRYGLRELRSVRSLRRVGRKLRNCVEGERWARSYLHRRDAALWVLLDREERRPLCLMAVDADSREITECEGFDGSTPELERPLAFAILDALDVSGDHQEAFARVEAYSELRNGQPEEEVVKAGDRWYRIWVLDGGEKFVIASRRRPGGRWRRSRFTRDGDEIDGGFGNALSTGELLALVLDHPALAAKLPRSAA